MFRNLRWYRYVWSELAGPTALGLSLWTFLLMMNAFFVVAEKALAKNLGWELAFRMFVYEIPKLLVMSIPMTVLLATLIAVGRLSADQEWVALQSAGYGPSRVVRPVLIYGLTGSLLCFAIYAWVVPRSNYASRHLRGQMIILSNLASDLRPGVFYTQLPGLVMFVDNIRPGTEGRLEGVMLHHSAAHGDSNELILARSGDLYPSPDGSGKLIIDLNEGVSHHYSPQDWESYQLYRFESQHKEFPPPPFLSRLRDAPTRTVYDMGPVELWREVRAATSDTKMHPVVRETRLRIARFELHRRIALPLASMLFAALAVPLGVTRSRSGKGAGFALSLAVILIYWVVFTLAQDQAVRGGIPPWSGAWSANLVLAPWAVWGYWRLRRSRGEGYGLVARLRDGLARISAPPGASLPGLARSGPAGEIGQEADEFSPTLADLGGTTNRFVGRIDQYVGLKFLRLLGLTLLAAYLIYTIVDLKRLVEGVLKNDHPPSLLLDYLLNALPGMINLTLPVACLVAGIATFTLLARTGELTAIKASGISVRRAIVPVLVLTSLLCGLLFLVQDQVRLGRTDRGLTLGWALTPSTNRKAEEIRDRILGRVPITWGMPAGGKWAFGPEGRRLYHWRLYDPDRQQFQGFSVLTVERGDRPRILDHRFHSLARWDGVKWSLGSGWYRTFPADGSDGAYEANTDTLEASLDPPANFTRREAILSSQGSRLQDQMSLEELTAQIRELGGSGYDTTRLEVARWGKLAQPLTPLVMVLLGLPFAFRVGRRGSLYGIGVAILLVIVYWATFAVFNALGLETILPPLLAAWTPNVLYSALGIYLLLYIRT